MTDTHKTKISVFSCFKGACSKWQPWERATFHDKIPTFGWETHLLFCLSYPSPRVALPLVYAEGQSGSEPPTWNHFPCLMPISGSGSEGAWEAHTEFRLVPGLLGL